MRKVTYQAIFEVGDTEGYSVYFPDLPGCYSVGDTLEEAQNQATDALSLHYYGMERDGDEIPSPSVKLYLDPDLEPGFLVCPITIFPDLVRTEMDNRRLHTNVTIPAWLKTLAEQKKINISRVTEAALMDVLEVESDRNGRVV